MTFSNDTNNEKKIEELDAVDNPKKTVPFKAKIVWFNAIGFLLLHLAAFYGIYLILSFSIRLPTFIFGTFLFFLGSFSMTLGSHRLYCHRGYKAKLPLRIVLLLGQTISGQNCMWVWVREHRQHHKYSDTDADPHNANRGFFFCHIGWLMTKKHPEVIAKGKQIDMSDLTADPYIMFQKKYYKTLYLIFALVLPVALPCYLWNETFLNSLFVCYFARYVLQLNQTWIVNSIAHSYGNKPYDKTIRPVENTFVAIVAVGEGWHNYHHVFPWDCFASEYGKDYNGSTRILKFFEKMGWAYDLRSATKEMTMNKVEKYGDGTYQPVES